MALYSFLAHGYENGALARSLKLVLIKNPQKRMASRYFAKLLSCFSLRYFPRGAVQQNVTPKLFSLCRLNEKKTTVFHKVANFFRFGRKVYQASSIDRQKEMKAETVYVAVVVGGRGVVQGLC